jgi:hypothetical protein
VKRFKAQVDPWRNHTPHIGTILGHHINIGRCAKVDNHSIAAMSVKTTRCIGEPIRTNPSTWVDPWCHRQKALWLAYDKWTAVKEAVSENP